MRRLALLLIALLAATAVAAPALAAERRVNVLQKFRKVLPTVKHTSGIPVRLPATMKVAVRPKRVHGSGKAFREGIYQLDLGIGRNCNGGTACMVATFFGEKGGKKTNRIKVKLARGHTGRYRPVACGASCGPASIQWKQGRVLYEIQVKGGTKGRMKSLANRAIKGGPR